CSPMLLVLRSLFLFLRLLTLPFFPSFSLTAPPPPDIYTLSLHDALPIYPPHSPGGVRNPVLHCGHLLCKDRGERQKVPTMEHRRSEEHTSELQSRFDLVCRLLLEKKKSKCTISTSHEQ